MHTTSRDVSSSLDSRAANQMQACQVITVTVIKVQLVTLQDSTKVRYGQRAAAYLSRACVRFFFFLFFLGFLMGMQGLLIKGSKDSLQRL